jgi:single-stranded-DNA-specific exonuclease
MLLDAAAVVPHTDADGLAAGAIALRARGEPASKAILLGRGENPFGPRDKLPAGLLAILDQGVRPFPGPALFVDHHAPEAGPGKGQLVVSGFGEPFVSTSVLMRRIVPEAPAWVAAVGAAGDYGDDGLKRPECQGVVKSHVKKLVPLINAPRRCPDGPVRDALALLVECDSAKAALADERIALLDESRRQYKAEFERVVRTAPKYVGPVAVLRFESEFQVHPLVAQTWSRRLAPRPVLAANAGYLPGRVNFAVRAADASIDLRQLLRDALPDQAGEFAHGHPQATGGSLTVVEFESLLSALKND